MFPVSRLAVILASAVFVNAQNHGGPGSGGYYGPPGDNNGGDGFDGRGSPFGLGSTAFFARAQKIVTAHAVLGAIAFVLLFPTGSILVRLGNFRGLWLVHGLFQAFAYLVYIAAAGLGIYITTQVRVINNAHPIIGIVLLILLFFQPILGFLHHVMFKKHSRRVVWSYGHIWLGRIIITVGIINGGLGLQLARRIGVFAPSTGAIVAYSVVAAVAWLAYVAAIIIGERRRRSKQPPAYKQSPETLPGAPHGVGEYYKNQHTGQRYS